MLDPSWIMSSLWAAVIMIYLSRISNDLRKLNKIIIEIDKKNNKE